jgi:hypothetical protein
MSDKASDFEERLNRHPVLKMRLNSLLDIVENKRGDYDNADDAESEIINEIRRMSNEVMHEWASGKEKVSAEELRKNDGTVVGHGKKNFTGRPLSEK